MSTPVPFEYPIIPISQYDPMMPPFVPNVQILPDVQYIVPMVASAVANEVSIKANAHAARMFCYNMLCSNYWNNESFAEVVKLVADLVCLNFRKQHLKLPESGIKDAAEQVLTMYTSSLIFQYATLKSAVTSQIVNASHQNVSTFNNLKQEIQSMYANQNGQPFHGFQGQGNSMGAQSNAPMMQPQMGGQQQYQQIPGYPPNVVMTQHGPMVMTPQGMIPFQGMQMQSNYPPQQMQPMQMPQQQIQPWGGNQAQQPQQGFGSSLSNGVTAARFGSASGDEAADIRQDRFMTRPTQQYEQPKETPPVVMQAPPKPVSPQSVLLIEKGSEMDRQKHQISYLGDSYQGDTIARGRQFAESSANMAKQDVSIDEENIYVHAHWIGSACLDIGIFTGRKEHFKKQSEGVGESVFRAFSLVISPFITTTNVQDYLDKLMQAKSFTEMAIKLKAFAGALNMKASASEESRKYSDSIVSFLKQIDNIMTDMANDFLNNKMKLKLTIDSFTDDVSDLGNYLYKTYGVNYSQAFSKFEEEAIEVLTQDLTDDMIEGMREYYDVPEGLHFSFLPLNYSFTYIPMNEKELGYKVGKEALVIDKETAPSLYTLCKSLDSHKKQMELPTIYDLLITADNVRYKLYRSYGAENEYLISKA